ncbi:hypothetical protein HN643_04545 [Candidatus Falkowbacteria bacterium]|nr:hypothetical protein [Candidatus Falkowbacteria bacterium]MBT5503290.1 hypothetical protein [Candidatus Falkowbacteria bacterium]MBT6574501.1 hypothetical protein [Candidatus Falkowbacteria bacterium]MBT7500909.1 hypothetical protein [Candidatus Falkowbacteria bacterium]
MGKFLDTLRHTLKKKFITTDSHITALVLEADDVMVDGRKAKRFVLLEAATDAIHGAIDFDCRDYRPGNVLSIHLSNKQKFNLSSTQSWIQHPKRSVRVTVSYRQARGITFVGNYDVFNK